MENRDIRRWHTVTPKLFADFVEVSGDGNALHVNPDFARALLGPRTCTNAIAHGALIGMLLSRDVWEEYGDGAVLDGVEKQRFLLPVEVCDQIGFTYLVQDRKPGKIYEWDAEMISVKIVAYKALPERILRVGGTTTVVKVPSPQAVAAIWETLAQQRQAV